MRKTKLTPLTATKPKEIGEVVGVGDSRDRSAEAVRMNDEEL